MFQLHLNFLARQMGHFRAPGARENEQDKTWIWKHGLTVHLVRSPRARRYLLRLQADGTVRLVIPRRGSRAEGVRFLERSEAWLLKQSTQWRKRNAAKLPWIDGTRFFFRGEEVILRVENFHGNPRLCFSDQIIQIPAAQSDYHKPVLAHLRRLAERELPPRTRELAQVHHIPINRVTVRAQKTRWGSCSARGTISLNWRLIQAPASVSDYLIIHELMHRREMNHSSRYWKLVEEAFPNYRHAEQWLKRFRLDGDYLAGAA
jgi:predicted metal-dependent hydrolase